MLVSEGRHLPSIYHGLTFPALTSRVIAWLVCCTFLHLQSLHIRQSSRLSSAVTAWLCADAITLLSCVQGPLTDPAGFNLEL
jgi:hypothetical protein